jgi:hypothetical protein
LTVKTGRGGAGLLLFGALGISVLAAVTFNHSPEPAKPDPNTIVVTVAPQPGVPFEDFKVTVDASEDSLVTPPSDHVERQKTTYTRSFTYDPHHNTSIRVAASAYTPPVAGQSSNSSRPPITVTIVADRPGSTTSQTHHMHAYWDLTHSLSIPAAL